MFIINIQISYGKNKLKLYYLNMNKKKKLVFN